MRKDKSELKSDEKKKNEGITKDKKTKTLIIAASVCLIAGTVGIGFANADSKDERHNSLINSFVQKFNLNESDVEEVFTQHREQMQTERRAEMKKQHEERLDKAVADGKITAAQKDLVLAKIEETQAQKDEVRKEGKEFREERRAEMQKHRDEMKKWASDNGIPEDVMGVGKNKQNGGGRGGMGGGMYRNR